MSNFFTGLCAVAMVIVFLFMPIPQIATEVRSESPDSGIVLSEVVFAEVIPEDVCFSSEGVPLKESRVSLSVNQKLSALFMVLGGQPFANFFFKYINDQGDEVHNYYVLDEGKLVLSRKVVFEGNLCLSSQK